VEYTRFFNLFKNGDVSDFNAPTKDPNINLNLLNIDMNYTWQVAPGSFINVNWKTSAGPADRLVANNYFYNLKETFDTPQFNSFSVKIIYYLDYLDLKKKK
jgi:hypothetical protein